MLKLSVFITAAITGSVATVSLVFMDLVDLLKKRNKKSNPRAQWQTPNVYRVPQYKMKTENTLLV